MYLPLQGFISSFRLLDILDILLVAFVLYKLFILIRNTRAVALIKGLLVLGVVTVVSKVLDLHVINWMLQQGMTVILVALPSSSRNCGGPWNKSAGAVSFVPARSSAWKNWNGSSMKSWLSVNPCQRPIQERSSSLNAK